MQKISDNEHIRDLQYGDSNEFPIKTVEINVTDVCNRACSFCPQSSLAFKASVKNKLTVETARGIALGLSAVDYSGRIGFVGFGEPLLNKDLEACIKITHEILPKASIEVITNGDYCTSERIKSLANAGCDILIISMYDRDVTSIILERTIGVDIQLIFRHRYEKGNTHGEFLVDRKNTAFGDNKLFIERACYIPFCKIVVDCNGDILTCENDWSKSLKFGNLAKSDIISLMNNNEYINFKKHLATGKRNIHPCNKCNINGTLRGEKQFLDFKNEHNIE